MIDRVRRKTTCDEQPEYGCAHARQAAKDAVKETFAILGVDVDSPKEVSAFQESLRFNNRLKKYADRGIMVLVGACAVATLNYVWEITKTRFFGG